MKRKRITLQPNDTLDVLFTNQNGTLGDVKLTLFVDPEGTAEIHFHATSDNECLENIGEVLHHESTQGKAQLERAKAQRAAAEAMIKDFVRFATQSFGGRRDKPN